LNVIQNISIGAIVLWQYCRSYYDTTQKVEGSPLYLAMPILPIVFHEESTNLIYKKNFDGGFYRVLTEKRDFPVGIQERMQSMSELTFQSLNLAFTSKLLIYEKGSNQIVPIRKTKPIMYNNELDKFLKASDRLGYWFASIPLAQLCLNLKIHF
jgi:hypothetical protein